MCGDRIMSCFKALLLLAAIWLEVVSCKSYKVPFPWNVTFNSASVISMATTPNSVGFSVLSNGSSSISSDNETFVFAFLVSTKVQGNASVFVSHSEPTTFAVVMQKKVGSQVVAAVPVWVDAPFIYTNGSTFMDSLNFDSINLDETGNLLLYHKDNMVWQSFENPSDVLLPGQQLRYGMTLQSSISGETYRKRKVRTCNGIYESPQYYKVGFGSYVAEVARTGVVLYSNQNTWYKGVAVCPSSLLYEVWNPVELDSSPPSTPVIVSLLPYQVWTLGGASHENTVESASKELCHGYEAVLDYSGSELKLSYAPKTSFLNTTCEVPSISLLQLNAGHKMPLQLPYLQLGSNGDLIIFNYESSGWTAVSKLSDSLDHCKFPSPEPCKQDLDIQTSSYSFLDVWICDSNTKRCTNSTSLSLYNGSTAEAYQVEGVSHYATRFSSPLLKNMSFDECIAFHGGIGYNDVRVYDKDLKACYHIAGFDRVSFYRDNTTQNMIAVTYTNVVYGSLVPQSLPLVWILCSVTICLVVVTSILIVHRHFLTRGLKNILKLAMVSIKYTTINILNYFNKAVREIEVVLSTMQGLPRRYSYLELENATKGFSTKLGAGGYGSVYEGILSDGKHVAVKKLAAGGKNLMKQFVTELVGIGGISHLNIVKLYGFCIDGTTRRLLVYEFMPNGSLDKWLFDSDHEEDHEETLSWHQRVDIALGTARALCYLHEECSEPILHLDVKPQNILLDRNFVPKVADFGVAKLLENRDMTHATTTVRGTFGYMAPEWLLQSVATKKCDVYSYGLVLLEIIGGRRNTDWSKLGSETKGEDSSWYFPSWVVQQVQQKNIIEVYDEKVRTLADENREQAIMIVHLALWCIQSNASLRPTFGEIVETLENRRMIKEPPMAFHFNFHKQELVNSVT